MDCRGKQVLLTGATGGIGQAIAVGLDRAGALLTLVGRSEHKLAALCQRLDGAHQAIAADLNDAGQRERVVRQCQQTGLDIFVNTVGVMDFRLFEDQDPAAVDATILTKPPTEPEELAAVARAVDRIRRGRGDPERPPG